MVDIIMLLSSGYFVFCPTTSIIFFFLLKKCSNLLGRGSFVARLDEIRPDRAYHGNANRLFKHAALD